MANNKIGCSAGKTVLVDPNDLFGHNSGSNISVPLEDLNISVQLTTNKKARTVFFSEKKGGNTIENSEEVNIKFIEGATVNGKNVLTTNYTDLTTSFENGSANNSESLGITNIDIDFNSSYAPQIVINFIDIRGSAIFQNEDNLSSTNENKYATFFQLPYPLFELTVKGYYGKAVKYCLHMTKFNSKFNSQTGNFEITANYIGYTYAMLSDMLIGYLKAIAFTPKGISEYDKLNPSVLSLNDLMLKISNINTEIQKLAANDSDSELINSSTSNGEILDLIDNTIDTLASSLDIKEDTSNINKEYIIVKSPTPKPFTPTQPVVTTTTPNIATAVAETTGVVKNFNANNVNSNNEETPLTTYNTTITAQVEKFNNTNMGINLNLSEFTDLTKYTYLSITKSMINPDKDLSERETQRLSIFFHGLTGDDLINERKLLYSDLNTNYTIDDNTPVDVYKISQLYLKTQEARNKIQKIISDATISLAIKLKTKIGKSLGFDPTVRKIIEVFTTSVEVFLKVLYRVSVDAKTSTDRLDQLKKIIKPTNPNSSDLTTAIKGNYVIHPWPDYRFNNQDNNGYIEKYLGSATELTNPKAVTELLFIDELLKAFVDAAKASKVAEDALIAQEKNWIPINPFDTRIFTPKSPYSRIGTPNKDDVYTLILIRAMTFLGYTNIPTMANNSADITTMANAEAELINRDISDNKLKTVIGNVLSVDDILNASRESVLNDIKVRQSILKKNNGSYSYNYIFGDSTTTPTLKVLPVTNNFFVDWDNSNSNKTPSLLMRSKQGVFLTNYSDIIAQKPDDGGQYVRILNIIDYNKEIKDLTNTVDVKSVFILEKLKNKEKIENKADVGFNIFGGVYGVQEFINLDYAPDTVELPLRFVFYDDNRLNGLGYSRDISTIKQTNQDIDRYTDKIFITPYVSGVKKTFYGDNANVTHIKFGKNRSLFSEFYKDNKQISYPYVNVSVMDSIVGDNDDTTPISLFGSKWYYGQQDATVKIPSFFNSPTISLTDYNQALLFLSTLPWNGDSFEVSEIKHLFDTSGGFIHAPRLWVAYIGGLLWRADISYPDINSNNKIIGGGSGPQDPILWFSGINNIPIGPGFWSSGYLNMSIDPVRPTTVSPTRTEYLNKILINLSSVTYRDRGLDPLLLNIPEQVKNEFKKTFFDFVNGNGVNYIPWRAIAEPLEIWSGTLNGFIQAVDGLLVDVKPSSNDSNLYIQEKYKPKDWLLNQNFINIDTYKIILPVLLPAGKTTNINMSGNMFLEINGDYTTPNAGQTILKAMDQEVVIANAGPTIWGDGANTTDQYRDIIVDQEVLKFYVNTIINNLKTNVTPEKTVEKEIKQSLFGTTDENVIKFQLYKTCKNIYDKWLGGVSNENNIIFQCGGGNLRNETDSILAKTVRGDSEPKLIDSFRFVNRSFKDIGDDFYINPVPVNTFLTSNPNSSFYDAVSNLLGANNFDFIALPTFINFNDVNVVESMFDTSQYHEELEHGICGPSFVCVYVGEKSKHLDFKGSEYSNDGFDIQCNKDGNIIGLPPDFYLNNKPYENNVAVFAVNYSQQNQNIFKDITLDQNEFTETAESLQVVDDISKMGSENNRTFGGQNMFSVYSVRSYKAEVEMMGNAMIQPMMYFQLNNIPMFHGAYMITHVKHNIKPNFMSTHFTGVRIRFPETPLMTSIDMYKSLLGSIDVSMSSNASSNTVTTDLSSNVFPDISLFKLEEKINEKANPPIVTVPGGFVNPFGGNYPITSATGFRSMDGEIKNHKGLDFGTPYDTKKGTLLQSIFTGTIEKIKMNANGFGLYMVINHGMLGDEKKFYKTVYGHLSNIDIDILNKMKSDGIISNTDLTKLPPNEVTSIVNGVNPNIGVTRGQVVAESGGIRGINFLDSAKTYDFAGHSTGAHLHFELRLSDSDIDFTSMKYVNAVPYLPLGQNAENAKYLPPSDTQDVSASITFIQTPKNEVRITTLRDYKNWD